MSSRLHLGIAALSALLSTAFVAARVAPTFAALAIIAGSVALAEGALLGALHTLRAPSDGARALMLGFALSASPIYALAKVLKATTHHRPLGAVTFAFLALFVMFATVAVALRVVGLPASSGRASLRARMLAFAALLSLLVPLQRLVRDAATQGGTVDVAVALGTAALLCLLPWPARVRGSAQRVGPWLWTVVVVLGIVLAFGPARADAFIASPALAAPLTWF